MCAGRPLDNGGVHANHANQCKKGGHAMRRHRVVRWLAGWIEDRIGSQVLVEQAVAAEGEEEDRLDLTLESGGRRLWLDVAAVNVMTINAAERLRRAKLDGAAARHEEGAKRSKYRGLATPFVIEAHGRPGDFARSIIGRFARDSEQGNSTDVAKAWRSLSAIVQSEPAALELRSCGHSPADWDHVGYYIWLAFSPTKVTTGTDVERRGTGPMGHARILSEIIVSNWLHSGSTEMSSLPRPMVSVGTATSLPPLPGPSPSPTSLPAAHSGTTDARRCFLAPSQGRCRPAATRSTSSAATSAAGVLFSLRCIRRCTGWCGGLTPPTTRAQGCHAQGCHAHSEPLARTGLPGPAGCWPYPGSGLGFRASIALGSISRRPRSAEGVPGGLLRHYVGTVARRNACRGGRVWDRGTAIARLSCWSLDRPGKARSRVRSPSCYRCRAELAILRNGGYLAVARASHVDYPL